MQKSEWLSCDQLGIDWPVYSSQGYDMPDAENAGKDQITSALSCLEWPQLSSSEWHEQKSICPRNRVKPRANGEWQFDTCVSRSLLCSHGNAWPNEESLHHRKTYWKFTYNSLYDSISSSTSLFTKILNLDYDSHLKSLIRTNSKKSQIEPNMFIVGSICLLQQFHPSAKL